MQKKILRREPLALNTRLSGQVPLLERIYAARGVKDSSELDYQLARLLKPTFKGLDEALDLLADAIYSEAKILIVGDFDADGATSSALAVLGFRMFGHKNVDFLVPNRFEYGYGLTPEIVEVAAGYHPDIILTVDNGISSVEGVAAAQALGIAVVVTDHHLPGSTLPNADAIVNPNQPDCPFPSKNLAGVGVIFYVMTALRTRLREMGWFDEQSIPDPKMTDLLDLVALGTVADVVPLDHNNRVLVTQGLMRIRAGYCRPGIRAIAEIAGKSLANLRASDFGFAIGPRLNAAGRLDDMSLGIRCLMSDSEYEARDIAQQLDELNRDRKAIEAGMQQEALKSLEPIIQRAPDELPWGLCLYDQTWHQGVIGILASRIKERFHRPTIVFADADHGEIKGSARSIDGFHIRDALDAVAAKHPHLLTKFGGHAMAAGMSLRAEHFAEFAAAFDSEVKRQLTPESLDATLFSDGVLDAHEFTLDLAAQLRDAGPWGQHFPEPVFDGQFRVVQRRVLSDKHLKLTLAPNGDSRMIVDAIAFNVDQALCQNTSLDWVRIAYKMDINEFRGKTQLQLLVDHIEPLLFNA